MSKNRRPLNVFTYRDENPGKYQLIPISSIISSPYQPRQYFDPSKLEELAATIRKHGILEPLLVRFLSTDNRYELIAGERRYRAATIAERGEVPAVILELTDTEAQEVALIDNLQREDLNPVEETEGILNLLAIRLDNSVEEVKSLLYRLQKEKKGKAAHNVVGQSETEIIFSVFDSLGILNFESFINHRLPLLNLPEDILDVLRQGEIAYTKAVAIAKITDDDKRQSLLNEAIEQNLSLSQIKERIKLIAPKTEEDTSPTPSKSLDHINKRFKKAQLWKNPQKWKKAQGLLKKLEALLEEEEAG